MKPTTRAKACPATDDFVGETRELREGNIPLVTESRHVCAKVIAIVALLLMLAGYGFYIYHADRGFDITDESFYLLNAFHPDDVEGGTSSFGAYLHVFSLLLGGNVVGIRVLGIILLFLLSCAFSYQLMKFAANIFHADLGIWESLAYLSMIVFSGLVYYGWSWRITPSYNWLSLIAFLLVGIGLLMTARFFNYSSSLLLSLPKKYFWLGTFLIGAGGALSFHSIPPASVALGLLSSFWLLMFVPVKKLVPTFVLSWAFFISSLVMHILVFGGGFPAYYHRLRNGILGNHLLQAGHTFSLVISRTARSILRTLNPLGYFQRNTVSMILLATAFVLVVIAKKRRLSDPLIMSIWKIAVMGSLAAFMIGKIASPAYLDIGRIGIDLLMFMILCLCLNGFVSGIRSTPRFRQILGMVIVISSLGVFVRFGSATQLFKASSAGYVFYVAGFIVGIIALAKDSRPIFRLMFATLVLIPIPFLLFHTYARPYRLQEPISAQIHPVTFRGGSMTLRVDEGTRDWVASLQAIAEKAGWKIGNRIIDMTGGTPGAAVVLGGRAPGVPWLSGGYSGSTEFATNALSLVDRDILSKAWILTAPEGKRRIRLRVLKSIGIRFPSDYELVGEVRTGRRTERQFLWKPLPSRDHRRVLRE